MATKDELLTAFQENYEILVSYATAIAGNRENALDVVQTLAVKLLETDGREVQTPLAFLYAMTRRVAIDMYRHEKHSLPLPPDWMHRYGATDDGRNYRLWELECSIQESLSQEPPRMREALIRHVLYGERVIDLSRELAINAATLRQRFHRMIKSCRRTCLCCCRYSLPPAKSPVTFCLSVRHMERRGDENMGYRRAIAFCASTRNCWTTRS